MSLPFSVRENPLQTALRLKEGLQRHYDPFTGMLDRMTVVAVFPGIEAKGIPGYLGIELLRRNLDQEVEFITIMTFESLDDVKAFQGEDFARAYIPARAKDLLKRWDEVSSHYEVVQQRF